MTTNPTPPNPVKPEEETATVVVPYMDIPGLSTADMRRLRAEDHDISNTLASVGMREWALGPVAARDCCERLKGELAAVTAERDVDRRRFECEAVELRSIVGELTTTLTRERGGVMGWLSA